MGAPLFFDAGLFEAAHSPRKFLWVCPFRGAFRVPPPHGRGNTENYLCGLENLPPHFRLVLTEKMWYTMFI